MAADVIPALVSCLEFGEDTVQRTAADALSTMGVDAAARAQFLSSGGVAALLPIILSPHVPLVTSALGTIRATAQSREVAQEFCAKGSVSLPLPSAPSPLSPSPLSTNVIQSTAATNSAVSKKPRSLSSYPFTPTAVKL